MLFSSAIKRAVDDASNGNYASAIETLLNAISSIKTSKVHFRSFGKNLSEFLGGKRRPSKSDDYLIARLSPWN